MPAATDMGGRGSSGGGRGGRDRRGQGTGRGMRRRRRDGRGEGLCHAAGGDSTSSAMTAVMAPIPGTKVPVSTPAVTSRARAVAVVARPESCIACGSCVEACRRSAISIEEIAVIDGSLCTGCGLCVDDCSSGALALLEV